MTRRAATIACLAIGGTAGLPLLWAGAAAQDAGGRFLGIGVSQGVSVISNDDLVEDGNDRTSRANTNVSLSLSDATRFQSLRFGTGITLRAENETDADDTTFEIASPSANLAYTRNGPGSGFSANASFSRVEIDTLERIGDLALGNDGRPVVPGVDDPDPIDGPNETPGPDLDDPDLDGPDLDDPGLDDPGLDGEVGLDEDGTVLPQDVEFEEGDGTRQVIGLSTGLRLRQNAPLSFSFRASATDVSYSDTTDPDLEDNRRLSFGATTRAVLSPIHTLSLGFDYGIRDEDGEETERVTGVDAGLSVDRPGGNYTVNVGADLDEDDDLRTRATLGIDRDLRRGGVGATIGATQGEGGDLNLIGSLNAGYQVPLGQFSVQASRSVARLNEEDGDEVVTVVSGQFSRALSPRSNLGLNATLVQTRLVDAEAEDVERDAAIGVNFSRQLSPDWSFSTGARQVFSETEDDEWISSQRVFFNVGRQFGYRF